MASSGRGGSTGACSGGWGWRGSRGVGLVSKVNIILSLTPSLSLTPIISIHPPVRPAHHHPAPLRPPAAAPFDHEDDAADERPAHRCCAGCRQPRPPCPGGPRRCRRQVRGLQADRGSFLPRPGGADCRHGQGPLRRGAGRQGPVRQGVRNPGLRPAQGAPPGLGRGGRVSATSSAAAPGRRGRGVGPGRAADSARGAGGGSKFAASEGGRRGCARKRGTELPPAAHGRCEPLASSVHAAPTSPSHPPTPTPCTPHPAPRTPNPTPTPRQVCVEGPKEKLDSTAVSQPAIYVTSLAAVEKLRATEGQAAIDAIDVAAGLSLGEYTALAFAGAMT